MTKAEIEEHEEIQSVEFQKAQERAKEAQKAIDRDNQQRAEKDFK